MVRRPLLRRSLIALTVLALWLGTPAIAPKSDLNLLIFSAVNALVIVGLGLLLGYAGQISLGQAGFYAFGAYGSALLSLRLNLPVAVSIAVATVGSGLVGYILGRPILRLKGYYLAMATAALGLIIHTILVQWQSVTGGYSGIPGIPRLSLGPWVSESDRSAYYVVVGITIIVVMCCMRLIRTNYGRAMRTIRESEEAATSVGINVANVKAEVFALSTALAGLGGALYAHYVGYISPDSFTLTESVEFLLAMIIGGVGSLWGALAGAIVVTFLPNWLAAIGNAYGIIFGGLIVVILTVFPGGLVSILTGARRWVERTVVER